MKKIKITNYTKSIVVVIQYPQDHYTTGYIYEEENHKQLTKELLRIMETNQEVEVITKEYR